MSFVRISFFQYFLDGIHFTQSTDKLLYLLQVVIKPSLQFMSLRPALNCGWSLTYLLISRVGMHDSSFSALKAGITDKQAYCRSGSGLFTSFFLF